MIVLISAGSLIAPSISHGAQLKQETLTFWDVYLQTPRLETGSQTPFLWVDQTPERLRRVRGGEILVSSASEQNPEPVPSGLIHDWIGAGFIPHSTIEDVLSTVRDYDNYKVYYKPTVVDSKLLNHSGSCETYSMRVVNKEAVAQTALDMEYETCYFKIDDQRWQSITRTKRVQEIRHYGQADEQELPADRGSGYIWRLYSVARFEQRDGGTYVEVEAIALSRDIPTPLRWMVNPIVRRVSRNSMLISIQQTEEAVRSGEEANAKAKSPTTAENRSRRAFASEGAITNGFAPGGKP